MHAMKIITLFAFVLFGVYAQFDAEKTVVNVLNEQKRNDENLVTNSADIHFMKRAIELSHTAHSHSDGLPFGSIVVRDGVIIGEGWNKVDVLKDPSAHAEVIAIRDACRKTSSSYLKGSVLYASAQPCPMCLSLIHIAGVEKVFYCIPGKIMSEMPGSLPAGKIRSPEFERTIPEIQLMRESVPELLKAYSIRNGEMNL